MQQSRIIIRNFGNLFKINKSFLGTATAVKETAKQATEPNEIKTKIVKPFEHEDFFNVRELANVQQLFNARAHYGHHHGLRNPWMNGYIFGTRMNIDIINLDKTCKLFQDALNFAAHVAFKNGIIMFVTRDVVHIPKVEILAKECGEYAHCRQWFNGTFTDPFSRYQSVVRLPDLCIFLNTNDSFNEQHGAVVECAKMLIPTIAIVDTNMDPNLISFPIPANDDSTESIELYCDLFKKAILSAKEKRRQLQQEGYEISYN